MEQTILRAIQQEVRRIECKLDNPRTGLQEIKTEVAAIEGALRDVDAKEVAEKLRALFHEVEEIEKAIRSPKFGLEEIKEEVEAIEDAVDDPEHGLEEIKEDVRAIECALKEMDPDDILEKLHALMHEVEEIEGLLRSPKFGLEEIKEEVHDIEEALERHNLDPVLEALKDVKHEIHEVEEKLGSPHFGLKEIKEDVAAIERAVDDPETGLAEIIEEIHKIKARLDDLNIQQLLALLAAVKGIALTVEHKLDSSDFGLEEIKEEVEEIESRLDNPHFGLKEIKEDVEEIVEKLGALHLEGLLALLGAIEAEVTGIEGKLVRQPSALAQTLAEQERRPAAITSGPVFLASGARSVLVTVRNNAEETQTVTIRGFEIEPAIAPMTGSPASVTLGPGASATVKLGFPSGTFAYEISVLFTIEGSVGVFSAARTQDESAGLDASALLPENTVRYGEFRPLFAPVP